MKKNGFDLIFSNWNNMSIFEKPTLDEISMLLENCNLNQINEKTEKILYLKNNIKICPEDLVLNSVGEYLKILVQVQNYNDIFYPTYALLNEINNNDISKNNILFSEFNFINNIEKLSKEEIIILLEKCNDIFNKYSYNCIKNNKELNIPRMKLIQIYISMFNELYEDYKSEDNKLYKEIKFNDVYDFLLGIYRGNVQTYISINIFILELFDKIDKKLDLYENYYRIFNDKSYNYNKNVVNKNILQLITDYWIINYDIIYKLIDKNPLNLFKTKRKSKYIEFNMKKNIEKVNYVYKDYKKYGIIKKSVDYFYELNLSLIPNLSNLIKKDFIINTKDNPGLEYKGKTINICKITKSNICVLNYLSKYSTKSKQEICENCIIDDFYCISVLPSILYFYKILLSTPESFKMGIEYNIINGCDYNTFIDLTNNSFTFLNTHYDKLYYKIYKDYYSFRKSFIRDFKVQYFYNSFALSATYYNF